MMTLQELEAELARRYAIHPGDGPISLGGRTYTEVTIGHIGDEPGQPLYARTKEDAEHHLAQTVLRYAEGKTGMLYWRIKPEVGSYDYGDNPVMPGTRRLLWAGYARLAIC